RKRGKATKHHNHQHSAAKGGGFGNTGGNIESGNSISSGEFANLDKRKETYMENETDMKAQRSQH
uniref:Uncharacterized protein n=1 Tax=Megaselia scalaris TaxID=36166 RepID=T1GYL8_MEGSC